MKKILLIEDDSNYIWHIKDFLQRKGYHVLVASTVVQGFRWEWKGTTRILAGENTQNSISFLYMLWQKILWERSVRKGS